MMEPENKKNDQNEEVMKQEHQENNNGEPGEQVVARNDKLIILDKINLES